MDRALAAPDPWNGFREFATAFVRLRAESCGVGEALGGACGPALDQLLAEVRDRIRRLVERAQASGRMRPDVAWQDVPFLLAAIATGPRTIGLQAGDRQWNRDLWIVLDGLTTPRPRAHALAQDRRSCRSRGILKRPCRDSASGRAGTDRHAT